MSEHRREHREVRRVHISEAAEALGVSKDALRMRIRRGTLESDKGEDGRVYVYLYDDHESDQDTVHHEPQVHTSALVEAKDETIRHLSEQLEAEREARRRADTIIAQLSQANATLASRVPQLEAPREQPEATQRPQEGAQESGEGGGGVKDRGEPESRSWWRRVFGG